MTPFIYLSLRQVFDGSKNCAHRTVYCFATQCKYEHVLRDCSVMDPLYAYAQTALIFIQLKSSPKLILMQANNMLNGRDLDFIAAFSPLMTLLLIFLALATLLKIVMRGASFDIPVTESISILLPGIPLLVALVWLGFAMRFKNGWIVQPEWVDANYKFNLWEAIVGELDHYVDIVDNDDEDAGLRTLALFTN